MRRALAHAAAAGLFALYALLVTHPLAFDLDGQIPGRGAGDNLAFLWNFWWFRAAWSDPGLQPFHTWHLFAPFGVPLVLHTHTALPATIGAILPGLTVTQAHNVVLLAGLAANGLAAYALARHHVPRMLPALLAGVVFAGSAYIAIRLNGHFNLVHAWVLPLTALAWIRCLESPGAVRGAIVAIAFAAAAYTDYYYFVFAAMFAGAWWALTRWQPGVRWVESRAPRVTRTLAALVVVLAAFALAIALTGGFRFQLAGVRISASHVRNPLAFLWIAAIAWLALHLRVHVTKEGAPPPRASMVRAVATAGALLIALLLPLLTAAATLAWSSDYTSPPHTWRSGPRGIDLLTIAIGNPMASSWSLKTYESLGIDMMEQAAWLGIVPLGLLVIAAFLRLPDAVMRRWMVVGGLFMIWSCGAYLVVGGVDTGLPLPQALGRLVPVLSNARMPGRAFVMVQLAAALLCALTVARLGWRSGTLGLAVTLAAAEGAVGALPMYRLPSEGRIEAMLAGTGGDAILLELPTGVRDGFGEIGRFDHRALAFQMTHGLPIAGGFAARVPARVTRAFEAHPSLSALLRLSAGESVPLPASLAADLVQLGIVYVVVNSDTMPREVGPLLEAHGMRLVMADGPRYLYVADGRR